MTSILTAFSRLINTVLVGTKKGWNDLINRRNLWKIRSLIRALNQTNLSFLPEFPYRVSKLKSCLERRFVNIDQRSNRVGTQEILFAAKRSAFIQMNSFRVERNSIGCNGFC